MCKRKLVASIAVFSLIMAAECVSVFAAPKYMKDGTVFDSEYYALANPDVVKVFGTSEKALWRHYRNWGRKEKRSPYDPIAYQVLLAQAVQNEQIAQMAETAQAEAAVQAMDVVTENQTVQAETEVEAQAAQTVVQVPAAGVNLNDTDAVINTVATEAMMNGYSVVEIRSDNPDNLSAASEVWIDMINSRGAAFRVVYGPKGNISYADMNVPSCRLALCEFNSDLFSVRKCSVANSVENLVSLIESNK